MRADPIDGLGIFDADVVDDGKNDAECSDAEQDNPIQGFEIDESVLIKLLNEFFHVGQYTKKNPLVAGPFFKSSLHSAIRHAEQSEASS